MYKYYEQHLVEHAERNHDNCVFCDIRRIADAVEDIAESAAIIADGQN